MNSTIEAKKEKSCKIEDGSFEHDSLEDLNIKPLNGDNKY